jgi:ABC-type phosphate/phosphonate transport system substrate-binding protein
MLLDAGVRPGADVRCRYYGHHDQAARAVLMREAAACGIRDLTGERFKGRGLRVLAISSPIPNFPFAVGPQTPPQLAAALVDALVQLPERDAAVARTMAGWDEELSGGFAAAAAGDYVPLGNLALRVFGRRALQVDPAALVCGTNGGPPGL